MRRLFLVALPVLASSCTDMTIAEIARDGDVGTLVADHDNAALAGEEVVFVANDGAPAIVTTVDLVPTTIVDMASEDFTQIPELDSDAAGNVAFIGRRMPDVAPLHGIYTMLVGEPVQTLFEDEVPFAAEAIPVEVALSPNGSFAFSTTLNGFGTVERGTIDGPVSTLVTGSGTFFNGNVLAINDDGRVAGRWEYGDPLSGTLDRGLLVHDDAPDEVEDSLTVLERAEIGAQFFFDIAPGGTVVVSLPQTISVVQFDGGDFVEVEEFGPGIYTAEPGVHGDPIELTPLVEPGAFYETFGRVHVGADDQVVFEATLESGTEGIFFGANAVGDWIVLEGDTLEDTAIGDAVLVDAHGASALFYTTDADTSETRLWRADAIPAFVP